MFFINNSKFFYNIIYIICNRLSCHYMGSTRICQCWWFMCSLYTHVNYSSYSPTHVLFTLFHSNTLYCIHTVSYCIWWCTNMEIICRSPIGHCWINIYGYSERDRLKSREAKIRVDQRIIRRRRSNWRRRNWDVGTEENIEGEEREREIKKEEDIIKGKKCSQFHNWREEEE